MWDSPHPTAGRGNARSSLVTPLRMSGRSRPLRSRAASSAASFDAPSAAASAGVAVSASYYSPLATASTDRRDQAEEDAEKEEAGAVVGGKVDGAESSSTDSRVRVGLSVHSGHTPVGLGGGREGRESKLIIGHLPALRERGRDGAGGAWAKG